MDIRAMADKDFLQPLLDMMNRRMDVLEMKVDANTAMTNDILTEAKETHNKVNSHAKAISRLENHKGRRLNLSPNVIYLIALGTVIVLAIIASILRINLGGLLK